jgi:hypothetical protein
MEYLWTVICPKIEDRSTIVLDMQGVALKDIGGEVSNANLCTSNFVTAM